MDDNLCRDATVARNEEGWLTTVEVAGVDGVVDDAVLVELVVQDLHLDLEELVLPACVQKSSGRTVFS